MAESWLDYISPLNDLDINRFHLSQWHRLSYCRTNMSTKTHLFPNTMLYITFPITIWNKAAISVGWALMPLRYCVAASTSTMIFSSRVDLPTPKSRSVWRVNRRMVFHWWLYVCKIMPENRQSKINKFWTPTDKRPHRAYTIGEAPNQFAQPRVGSKSLLLALPLSLYPRFKISADSGWSRPSLFTYVLRPLFSASGSFILLSGNKLYYMYTTQF